MRFIMFMIPGVYQSDRGRKIGADFTPGADDVAKMMKFNEELAKAGILISLDGFHPPIAGARIRFPGGKPVVMEGLTDSKEVVGGYWMIRTKSREEAIGWAKRVPVQEGDVIEVRQVFEMSDFPEDVRKAADNPVVNAEIEKHIRTS